MNVLYILGNGFDKAQGMKTSYPEFYQYLMEKTDNGSDLMQQLKNDINADKKLWSDMEEAFGKFTSKIQTNEELEELYFELSDNLQRYLLEEENSFAPSNNLKTKFQNDFISPSKYLGATDRTNYNEFEKKMPGGREINVMSLNYTNTLERLLSLDKNTDKAFSNSIYLRQIIHVHGILDDSIIIGVDNEQQIANEKFRENDDIKDFLVKVQSNHAMKYTRHNTCEKLIESAHLIILYGVSLGETDARWWKLIGEQFKKRNTLCVIQYLYLPNQITPTRKQLLGRFERRQRRCIMQKFGFKENEWPEDTINRLFFVVNSNTFKL